MKTTLDIVMLVVGVVFIARGARRDPLKNFELFFGLHLVLDNGAALLPAQPPLVENLLSLLSVIAILTAAVLLVAYVHTPAKQRPE